MRSAKLPRGESPSPTPVRAAARTGWRTLAFGLAVAMIASEASAAGSDPAKESPAKETPAKEAAAEPRPLTNSGVIVQVNVNVNVDASQANTPESPTPPGLPDSFDPANVLSPPRDPHAERQIRGALSGEKTDAPNAAPLLDDVLQFIRGRGSILDGSALDEPSNDDAANEDDAPSNDDEPTNEEASTNQERNNDSLVPAPSIPRPEMLRRPERFAPPRAPKPPERIDRRRPPERLESLRPPERPDRSGRPDASQRSRVAESLLRSARLLENQPGSDPSRAALVTQMRAEATRLLSP